MISRSLWTLWTVGNSDDILTVLCCPSLALCKCLSIGTKLKSSKPCEVPPESLIIIPRVSHGRTYKIRKHQISWSFLVDHAWKLMTWYSCYAFKSNNFWCPTQSRSLRDLPVPSSNSPKSFLSSLKAGHLQPPTFSVRSWNIPSPAFIILLASQPEITTKSPFFFHWYHLFHAFWVQWYPKNHVQSYATCPAHATEAITSCRSAMAGSHGTISPSADDERDSMLIECNKCW